jgi:outer membrane lipoprotein-sorting protein
MTKVLRLSVIILFLLIGLAAMGPGEAAAQGILNTILRRMDVHNQAVSSLQAEVTMTKFNSQLGVADTFVGSTSYVPKKGKQGLFMRLDWRTENGRPKKESISVIGERYEIYRERSNQVIEGKVKGAKNNASAGSALAFMSMSKDELKQNYDVQYIGEEMVQGGVKTARMLLTPKGVTSYKAAELWVDADGMPRQAKIVERNDDTSTVLLEKIVKNATLSAKLFALNYPKNVARIKA